MIFLGILVVTVREQSRKWLTTLTGPGESDHEGRSVLISSWDVLLQKPHRRNPSILPFYLAL